MPVIIDASALLAFVFGEKGGEVVAPHIRGGTISAVNLSEVLIRMQEHSNDAMDIVSDILRLEVEIEAFTLDDSIAAAALRPHTRHLGLSFADRACLALAQRLDAPILTADRDWAKLDLGLDIRQVRD